MLSALERRSPRWDDDVEGARETLAAAISLVLHLVGRPGEPGNLGDTIAADVNPPCRPGETPGGCELFWVCE